MGSQLRQAYEQAMRAARRHFERGEFYAAFAQLERAHILGQRHTLAHLRTHWWMLRVGWRRHDRREIVGQCARMAAALLFSRIWVPVGNTGGADVSAFARMELPEDLRAVLAVDD